MPSSRDEVSLKRADLQKTNNDTNSNATVASIEALQARLADGIDLALVIKQAHWNLKGPQFIGIHLMLDKFREEVSEWNDEMAERIVQLGGAARATVQEVNKRTNLKPYPTDIYKIADHLTALIERFAAVANAVRKDIEDTDEAGDVGTSDLFTEVSRGLDKQLWFLEAHVQEPAEPVQRSEPVPSGKSSGLLPAPALSESRLRSGDQRVFIRVPPAMMITASGAYRSAAEVISNITGTQARPRALEAIPDIAVGQITSRERSRLLQEGVQVFSDVQFKIFDDDLQPDPRARFWEMPDLFTTDNALTLTDVMRHVRADRAWPVTEGQGVTIAVIDSGIASDLPELPAGKKRSSVDPGGVYSGAHWQDPVGHGSMCATIAAGGGRGSAFRGVAPKATVIAARSDLSAIDVSTIYTGLILAKRQNRISGPLVISNSWGLYACGSQGYMPPNHPFMDVILHAVAEGITVVFAAGNNHVTTCKGDPRADNPNTIWGPNSHDKVITVGTVSRQETNRDPSTPHRDSSRGRGEWAQLRDKPDCVAPTYGVVVWGSSRRDMQWWGTSGACPQVAGLAALMCSVDPTLKPEQVASIIRDTCRHLDEPASCVGSGIIDCEAAVHRVQSRLNR